MDVLPKNQDALRRKAMKKRLSKWDSFFSKVQDDFLNSTGNNSCSDVENEPDLQDPKLLSINDEHNNLRRSLRMELGINEESEISESEAEWQQNENSDHATATDSDSVSVEATSSKKSPSPSKKRAVNQRKCDVLPKQRVSKSTNIKKPSDRNLGSPMNKRTKSDHAQTFNDEADIRKDTLQDRPDKDSEADAHPDIQTKKGKVIAELTPSLESKVKRLPSVQKFSTSTPISQEERLPNTQKLTNTAGNAKEKNPSEVQRFRIPDCPGNNGVQWSPGQSPQKAFSSHHFPVMTADDINRKLKIKELCKLYDLWKLQKRRRSGRRGSVHIVSDLNEELSDENRFVADLPPMVKNPFKTPRRFSLKKCTF